MNPNTPAQDGNKYSLPNYHKAWLQPQGYLSWRVCTIQPVCLWWLHPGPCGYFMSLHPQPFLTIINTHYPSGKIIFIHPMLLAILVRMAVPLPWRDCSGASRKTNTTSTSHLILEPRGPRSKQDYILSSSCCQGLHAFTMTALPKPWLSRFLLSYMWFMYSHTRVYVYLDTHAYTAYLGTGYSSI